jgi:hypothetical protein
MDQDASKVHWLKKGNHQSRSGLLQEELRQIMPSCPVAQMPHHLRKVFELRHTNPAIACSERERGSTVSTRAM